MGARVYLPTPGRFLSIDPKEGGTDNNYVYANDPVNQFDLDGQAIFIPIAIFVGRIAVQYVARQAATYVTKKAMPYLYRKAAAFVTKQVTPRLNNLAARAWTAGKTGSPYKNMMNHYAKHGSSMGYGSAWRYTLGALRNTIRTVGVPLRSGSVAHIKGRLVTQFYKGRVSSFMSSKNPTSWLRNWRL